MSQMEKMHRTRYAGRAQSLDALSRRAPLTPPPRQHFDVLTNPKPSKPCSVRFLERFHF